LNANGALIYVGACLFQLLGGVAATTVATKVGGMNHEHATAMHEAEKQRDEFHARVREANVRKNFPIADPMAQVQATPNLHGGEWEKHGFELIQRYTEKWRVLISNVRANANTTLYGPILDHFFRFVHPQPLNRLDDFGYLEPVDFDPTSGHENAKIKEALKPLCTQMKTVYQYVDNWRKEVENTESNVNVNIMKVKLKQLSYSLKQLIMAEYPQCGLYLAIKHILTKPKLEEDVRVYLIQLEWDIKYARMSPTTHGKITERLDKGLADKTNEELIADLTQFVQEMEGALVTP